MVKKKEKEKEKIKSIHLSPLAHLTLPFITFHTNIATSRLFVHLKVNIQNVCKY